MNENLTWLAQLIDSDRESLGLARCHSGDVREKREEMRLLWNDDCGRDLSRRYLDPIEKSWSSCGSKIESQAASLENACTYLKNCAACADRALALAREFAQVLEEYRSVEMQIESLRAGIAQLANEASESIAFVAELLQQAEQEAANG
jgi:hypothetical protein